MRDGELEKLIIELLNTEDAINWGGGFNALELIQSKIEEARCEFPLLSDTKSRHYLKALQDIKNHNAITPEADAVLWFVKWFGKEAT